MKASRFSEAQKAFILKQGADGMPVADICRKAGISQATYFNWKNLWSAPGRQASSSGSGPLGLHQSIRPVVGAWRAPGHDGFRASPSQLNYPACNRPLLPSGSRVTPVDRWSIILPLRSQTSLAKSRGSHRRPGLIECSLRKQCPGRAGLLVGERYCGDVRMSPAF